MDIRIRGTEAELALVLPGMLANGFHIDRKYPARNGAPAAVYLLPSGYTPTTQAPQRIPAGTTARQVNTDDYSQRPELPREHLALPRSRPSLRDVLRDKLNA